MQPSIPATIFQANFNASNDLFIFARNTFRSTNAGPTFSDGLYNSTLRALTLTVGGTNNGRTNGMSAGFVRSFVLARAANVSVEVVFDFNFTNNGADGRTEYAEALCSVDSVLLRNSTGGDVMVGFFGNDAVRSFSGNRTVKSSTLVSGSHEIAIGAHLNSKDAATENASMFIKGVKIIATYL